MHSFFHPGTQALQDEGVSCGTPDQGSCCSVIFLYTGLLHVILFEQRDQIWFKPWWKNCEDQAEGNETGDDVLTKVWTIKRNVGKSGRWCPKGSEDVLIGI